eukprot:gb/GEZN01018849.1/.p1 GENE.gb/GEZN01018849.1/~~gb/GEZN01018849.1/.p1  ORF type:complete len:221 (-),score=48.61 gb/GEZN01018849.1/:57-719(-)
MTEEDSDATIALLGEGIRKIKNLLNPVTTKQDLERVRLSAELEVLKDRLRRMRRAKGDLQKQNVLVEMARKKAQLELCRAPAQVKKLDNVQRQELRNDLSTLAKALNQYQKEMRNYEWEFQEFIEQKREIRRQRQEEQERQEEEDLRVSKDFCEHCLEKHSSELCPYMFDLNQSDGLAFEDFFPYTDPRQEARSQNDQEIVTVEGDEEEGLLTEAAFPAL